MGSPVRLRVFIVVARRANDDSPVMRPIVVLALTAALLGPAVLGCSRPAGSVDDVGVPYPEGCADHGLSMRRCDLVIDRIARDHGIDRTTVKQILLLGDPGCGDGVSPGTLCKRSGGIGANVKFVLPDGEVVEDYVYCGVEAMYDPECTDTPQIRIASPMHDGYLDVPEGATPVPTIDPASRALAQPLVVGALDIPIDRTGSYRVELGEATLPNGIVSRADLALANDHPTDLLLNASGIGLELPSALDEEPISNIYGSGWRAGVVRVRVVITFTVVAFDPGAVLQVRDVVVG